MFNINDITVEDFRRLQEKWRKITKNISML